MLQQIPLGKEKLKFQYFTSLNSTKGYSLYHTGFQQNAFLQTRKCFLITRVNRFGLFKVHVHDNHNPSLTQHSPFKPIITSTQVRTKILSGKK